jgi:hypothetical protein
MYTYNTKQLNKSISQSANVQRPTIHASKIIWRKEKDTKSHLETYLQGMT